MASKVPQEVCTLVPQNRYLSLFSAMLHGFVFHINRATCDVSARGSSSHGMSIFQHDALWFMRDLILSPFCRHPDNKPGPAQLLLFRLGNCVIPLVVDNVNLPQCAAGDEQSIFIRRRTCYQTSDIRGLRCQCGRLDMPVLLFRAEASKIGGDFGIAAVPPIIILE